MPLIIENNLHTLSNNLSCYRLLHPSIPATYDYLPKSMPTCLGFGGGKKC